MTDAEIFVAVPVFRGAELVAETLRSIRDQTFPRFRVAISVDGDDRASAEACRPFLDDPRFEMVVQTRRLGWAGNLNALIDRCDRPFFCYWQQDDLTAANYLEALRAEMILCPDAAIAFSDVQWFGARFDREWVADVHGSPAQRVLQVIEGIPYQPLRGLMRSEYLPRPGAIRLTEDESSFGEFPFLAAMAARGDFRRVTGTLYFKRAHAGNAYARWFAWPAERRRRAWIDMGLEMLRVAGRTLGDADRRLVLAIVVDRLAVLRPGRSYFHQLPHDGFDEIRRLTRDVVSRGSIPVPPREPRSGAFALARPPHPDVDRALDEEEEAGERRRVLGERLSREGELTLGVAAGGPGTALLGQGWSWDEEWGVWSDGEEARLWLPPAEGAGWRLRLACHHFAMPGEPARCAIRWSTGAGDPPRDEWAPTAAGGEIELPVDRLAPDGEAHRQLRLRLPGSVVPTRDGELLDSRRLGLALSRVSFFRH